MAIDRKLIQQVKQACARIKRAGISIGMEKLAGPFRGQPILPRRQQRQQYQAPAPQQQYRAPAPQQPAVGNYLTADDKASLGEQFQQSPQGMQRFHNPTNGEVFYAPNQQSANSYIGGGNRSALGIQAGMRRDQSPQSLHDAMGQEASSGPRAGLDAPSSPTVGNTNTQYDTLKGYDARTGAHAPSYGSGMDAAIAESKRIRAADPRNTAATLPTPAAKPPADDPSLRFNPTMTPLTQGANRPVHGSSGQPNFINAIKNVGTMAGNASGNALKAVGTAGPGTGMPGGYNRNAPGKSEFSASPGESISNLINPPATPNKPRAASQSISFRPGDPRYKP
jgi:hypothetical protein